MAQVVAGCVGSVEEKGYLLSFGLPSFSGFLLFKDQEGEAQLGRGQLIQAVVGPAKERRQAVLGLTMSSDLAKTAAVRGKVNLGQLGWRIYGR